MLLITIVPLTKNYTMERIAIKNLPKIQRQTINKYLLKKIQTLNLIYEKFQNIFNHPLYVKFFEPIYVGNKSDIWGHQIYNTPQVPNQDFSNQDFLIKIEQKFLDQFHKIVYVQWKSLLTEEELLLYQNAIDEYEQAYNDYQEAPRDTNRIKNVSAKIRLINKMVRNYLNQIN